jgi:NAD(P)-dependent dehydrogenase (short-subunit alcohol dehydrogenase family)
MAIDLQLTGKVALVTGASRGIGRAVAEQFAAEGVKLILVATTQDALTDVANRIKENWGTEPVVLAVDLRKPAGTSAVAHAVETHYGRLDILINSAGGARGGNFTELSDQDWEDGLALKLMASVRLCRALWPLLKQAHGAVVNLSGGTGKRPRRSSMIAGAVNAALANFSKALAEQGLLDDLNVNVVQPGPTDTGRLRDVMRDLAATRGASVEIVEEEFRAEYGMRRYGTPDELATLITYLVSHHARHIQGATVVIDGGSNRAL